MTVQGSAGMDAGRNGAGHDARASVPVPHESRHPVHDEREVYHR